MDKDAHWDYSTLNNSVSRLSNDELPAFVDSILQGNSDAAKMLLLLVLSRKLAGHLLVHKILLPEDRVLNDAVLSVLGPLRERALLIASRACAITPA